MSVPASRADFIAYCLRRLGSPVVQINVTAEQTDDAVDYALERARDFHFDFVNRGFVRYQIQPADIVNGWVPIPNNVIGIIDLFPFNGTLMGVGMWNLQYQAIFTAMDVWRSLDIAGWSMLMMNLQLMEEIFSGKQIYRYSRYENRLYVDTDWTMIPPDSWLVADAYYTIDPNCVTKVWGDPWLQQYTTALIKRVWGNVLKKYSGVEMLGGVRFNGQQIYDEAEAEIEKLDASLLTNYSLGCEVFFG
jgi:hypothetical protein